MIRNTKLFLTSSLHHHKMKKSEIIKLPRTTFKWRMQYQTNFSSNDVYVHLNNYHYHVAMDSAIDWYIANYAGIVPSSSTCNAEQFHQLYVKNSVANELTPKKKHLFSENNNKNNKLIPNDNILAFCLESDLKYFSSITAPTVLDIGLAVTKIGNSSACFRIGFYEAKPIGLFNVNEIDDSDYSGKEDKLCALGSYVHCFVSKEEQKKVKIEEIVELKHALREIEVPPETFGHF